MRAAISDKLPGARKLAPAWTLINLPSGLNPSRERETELEASRDAAMTKRSAGILLYRRQREGLEVLLVHPGGPLWVKRDRGAWSIPKGEYSASDDPLLAAVREFEEETGMRPTGTFVSLGEVVHTGKKIVAAWATERRF